MDGIVNFLFEVGMLKRTPRSGWQFLGVGSESVAEHIFRSAVVAFTLGQLDSSADADRLVLLALFHDLPEARTGDLNYVNQKYARVDEAAAARDMAAQVPFGERLTELLAEFRAQETREAQLAHDADQLDMLLQLKEHHDGGNPSAHDWTRFVVRRLKTDAGRALAERILAGDSSAWWFDQRSEWWVHGAKGSGRGEE